MWCLSRSRIRLLMLASPFAVSVIAVAVGGGASGATASKSLVAIHVQGANPLNQYTKGIHGSFNVELAKTPFARGTSLIYPTPAATRIVNGQEQTSFAGEDTLTNAKGKLVLAFRGIHIDVNGKLVSGQVVGPAAEYGTWKVRSATGIYQGWRGGGNWASVACCYQNAQPYSVEWDGYITS